MKSIANSIKYLTANLYKKLENKCPKKINSNLLVDNELNIIGKKIFKNLSITGSGVTLTNNENRN